LREVRSLSSGVIDYLVTSATEFIEEHARDAILLQYSQDSTPVKVRRHISKGSGALRTRRSGMVTEKCSRATNIPDEHSSGLGIRASCCVWTWLPFATWQDDLVLWVLLFPAARHVDSRAL